MNYQNAAGTGDVVARLILALVAFGVLLSYVRYGPGGPLRWWRAKFLGKTS